MTRRDCLGLTGLFVSGAFRPSPAKGASIESVAIYSTRVGPRAWVALELATSDGLTGLGDASAGERVPVTGSAVARRLLDFIRGRSPFEVERLRAAAMSAVAEAAPSDSRPTAAACSAVEQCMWDLQGKLLGLPCYELLGGALRTRIRNYANINRATRGDDRTAEGFAANALRGATAGFDAFKLAPFDHMSRNETAPARFREGVSRGIGFVRAVRQAIGPDRDLLVDGHSRFSASQAIEVGRRLEPLRLYWMEEMCRGVDDLRRFNDATHVQTAGGESLWGAGAFYDYIRSGAVDTVMPDVKYCGGMFELKKIAAMAEAAGLACSPHGPASPIGNMAAAHVCATLPNFTILEMAYGEVPWRADTVVPAESVESGYLTVPDRPGIGYELNPARWTRFDD